MTFFFRLFEGYRHDKLPVMTPKMISNGNPRKYVTNFTRPGDCENTRKILKISCVRCHFVKFVIFIFELP